MPEKALIAKESKLKTIYFTIAFIAFIAAVIVKLFYRNYIYTGNINDLGLADYLPSYLFVLGITNFAFCISAETKIKKVIKMIIAIAIGSLLYEFEQIFTSRVFDVKDVIAIIFGSLTSLFIFYKVEKRVKINHNS